MKIRTFLALLATLSITTYLSGQTTAPRPLTTVRGMVVITTSNGLQVGKVSEIIAVPVRGQVRGLPQVTLIGNAGQTMKTALQEAVRVARQRDERAASTAIEISFDEKYSPKDGGSAGTAFTLAILSTLGHFEIASDCAVTGDITVDEKVRPVGGIRHKVHGAALDRMQRVGVPTNAETPLLDGVLLDGTGLLWETQIFSISTLDDAIALVRKDSDAKLLEACKLFDEVRQAMAKRPVGDLATDAAATKKLARVRELAPNHLSAALLMKLSTGKPGEKLSLGTSLEELTGALGKLRPLLKWGDYAMGENGQFDQPDLDAVQKALKRVRPLLDPKLDQAGQAAEEYVAACEALLVARKAGARGIKPAMEACRDKRNALKSELQKITADKETFEKLIRE